MLNFCIFYKNNPCVLAIKYFYGILIIQEKLLHIYNNSAERDFSMNARIWCEVICNECGGMIGHFYHNSGSIRKLKEEIKDWKCVDGVNICGECLQKLNKKQEVKS